MSDTETFEAGGHRYRIDGKLNAIQQLHVVRRLSPLVSAFVGVDTQALVPDQQARDPERAAVAMQSLLGPLADGIAKLSDADTEYILGACMSVVRRDVGGGGGWAPMWNAQAKAMQFQDLSFIDLLTVCGRVLMMNLGDFGSALSRTGGSPAAVQLPM